MATFEKRVGASVRRQLCSNRFLKHAVASYY